MLVDASVLLLAVLVGPALIALVAAVAGKHRPHAVGQAGALVAGLGFLATCILAIEAGRDHVASATLGGLALSADSIGQRCC